MKSTTALLVGASLASAQEVYQSTVGRGPIPQSRFNGSDFDALRSPNASASVNFTVGGQEWTWRVNITDFSVPEASIEGKLAPDARIILATYDLQWPSNETFGETAASLNKQSTHASSQSTHGPQTSDNSSEIEDPICMSVLDDSIVWPNVTNNYESGSSCCEDLFGQDCMRAILMDQTYSADGGCSSPSLNIDACEGVFDTSGSYTQSASLISLGEANASNQTHPGDILYYQYGSASPQSNTTALRQAESRLRMILITLPNNVRTAACVRVDSSIDDIEVSEIAQRPGWNGSDASDAGSNSSGSSTSGGDESGAGARSAATMGPVGVVGVAVVMFGLL